MSCGTCGVQASDTMQSDTGVPAGAPTTGHPRCPHCKAFIAQEGADCRNPHCPGAAPAWTAEQAFHHACTTRRPSARTRRAVCADPRLAYIYARDIDRQPRDDTRAAACQHHEWAYCYARDVDHGPRDDTRQAACRNPDHAFYYARFVDRAARADTRAAACQDPHYAVQYAREVDLAPYDNTRAAACLSAEWAFEYARHIDHGPRDDTRQAACRDAGWAYLYAEKIDRQPHDDTRQAACLAPDWACKYALGIDHGPRDDTRQAACAAAMYAYEYARDVDHGPRADTRAAACHEPEYAFLYATEIDRAPRDDTRQAAAGGGDDWYWRNQYAAWERSYYAGPVRAVLTKPAVAAVLGAATESMALRGPQGQVEVISRAGSTLTTLRLGSSTDQVDSDRWQYGAPGGSGEVLAQTAFQNLRAVRQAQGWHAHCPRCGYRLDGDPAVHTCFD